MTEDAFRTELIALLPRLRRFALGLSCDREKADDLVQAACERGLARQHQWQQDTRLDSWMFKIIQNLWIDELRRTAGNAPVDLMEIEDMPDRDWNQDIESRLTLDAVLSAMERLPAPMRSVLMLVCVEGLSYKQAADTLELPIGTVMSRLARARIELNQQLSKGQSPQASRGGNHAQLH